MLKLEQEAVKTNFYSLRFDLTGNRNESTVSVADTLFTPPQIGQNCRQKIITTQQAEMILNTANSSLIDMLLISKSFNFKR